MADKTVCISQQQTKPIKILKWKVRQSQTIPIGRVILLYDYEGVEKPEQRKLKSTTAGTIHKILVQEGVIAKPGEILLELTACSHPTIMNDMCGECGADLRKDDSTTTASVPMVHTIPDLKVSEELAQKLGRADNERLIKERKLVLLVDLDQTLIHTTNDNIPPNIKDVYHFQLYGPNSAWYHTRFRPGTEKFLNSLFDFFELHICTFGARNYAHKIALFLDPEQKYFSSRILSRDECFDPTSKKANLKALFPCGDNMVCIIDDREDVWSHATNLIHVKPYHFFQHTGDINAPPGLDKHENDNKEGVDLSKLKNNDKKKTSENKELEAKEKEEEEVAKDNGECEVNLEENAEKVVNGCHEEKQENDKVESNNISEKVEANNMSVNNEETESVSKKDDNIDVAEPKEDVKNDDGDNDINDLHSSKDNDKGSVSLKKDEESLIEIEDPDDYLIYLEEILKRIHGAFYEEFDKMESGDVPDLKKVIPSVRNKVLQGSKLVFSGLVPTHVKLEQSKAYQVAKSLGAQVTQDLEEDTTHLVAVRPGTAKVNAGKRKKTLKIVTPDWLWSCAERWEHVDESIFPLNSKGSKNRHPPPHCSSPDHVTDYSDQGVPIRKRTASGRFMDTINPLMSFSTDDIADMDKEVNDNCGDSDSEDELEENNDELKPKDANAESSSSSSSSEDSMTGEFPRGYKRRRSHIEDNAKLEDDLNNSTEEDESPSVKFRRGEMIDSDLDLDVEESQDTDGSNDPPDDENDREWNMMGAALEREFLSNN